MSIFDSLKNAIFGAHAQAAPQTGGPPSQAGAAARPSSAGSTPPVQPTPQASNKPAPTQPVDVEAVLNQKAAQRGEKLNWRSSIVDLMKLVDLDPSLENRKTLAKELGYSGNTQDSASMNIWLHKEVMTKLAASGGKVPDSLRH